MAKLVRVVAAVCCVVVLASATCWPAPKVVREIELPGFPGAPFRPRIAGDWVVAIQNVDDKACASTAKGVIAYNIATGQTYTVFNENAGWPDIAGNLAVWTGKSFNIKGFCTLKGDRSGSSVPSNLILVDVTNWRYYTPPLATGPAFAPVAWGNYIAYEGKNKQVYVIEMNTGVQTQVSRGDGKHGNPAIGPDLVVWEEYTDKRQIRGFRISNGEQLTITDDPGAEHCGPRTDGATVVWWGNSEGVSAYSVATGVRTQITKSGFYADVDNGIAVYLKSVTGVTAVYGCDLTTGEEFRISSGKADAGPSIDNGRVIWCNDGKIYCAVLESQKAAHGKPVGTLP